MKIFRVLGLIIAIIALKFLMPAVFAGFENTLVAFFDTAQKLMEANLAGVSIPTVAQ